MDIELFETMMAKGPSQQRYEWRCFLEFLETYFRNRAIDKPIVVELGIRRNRQKAFWEKLLGFEHIGIDNGSEGLAEPDILGNTLEPLTLEKLRIRLKGKPINVLFIDADHTYRTVKSDYETFGALTKNIIALHDIRLPQYHGEDSVEKLWREIVTEDDPLAVRFAITCRKDKGGIGVIVKE